MVPRAPLPHGPSARLCWRRKETPPNVMARCDRRYGHTGCHSWDTTGPGWLPTSRYAQAYGITRHTVYKWLRLGILTWYRIGQVTRIKNLPPDQHSGTS